MNQVIANKGAAGVDGMTTKQLKGYLKRHWPKVKQELIDGIYRPNIPFLSTTKPAPQVLFSPSTSAIAILIVGKRSLNLSTRLSMSF